MEENKEEEWESFTLKVKYELTEENLEVFNQMGNVIHNDDVMYYKLPLWIKRPLGGKYCEFLTNEEVEKEVGDIIKGLE